MLPFCSSATCATDPRSLKYSLYLCVDGQRCRRASNSLYTSCRARQARQPESLLSAERVTDRWRRASNCETTFAESRAFVSALISSPRCSQPGGSMPPPYTLPFTGLLIFRSSDSSPPSHGIRIRRKSPWVSIVRSSTSPSFSSSGCDGLSSPCSCDPSRMIFSSGGNKPDTATIV